MLNIGMISKWHVHATDYAKQVQQNPNAQITAVWDEDPTRGAEWAAELGVPFYADYSEFLASDIHAVVCDSPTTMHRELLVKAAQAGKHIFTEKLLACTNEDAEAIAAAVRAANVTFTISLPVKGFPQVQYIKQLIDSGKLGNVTGARFRRSHNGVSGNWLPERWFNVEESGGGAMMDLGAHPVYVIADLLGEPSRVAAMMTNLCGSTSDENAIVLGEFPGGALATMETAFVTSGVPDMLEVYGTEGSVFFRWNEVVQNLGDGPEEVDEDDMPTRFDPMTCFIKACLAAEKEVLGLGLDDALVMTRIMVAAYATCGGATRFAANS